MEHSKNFITQVKLEKAINIPFSDIKEYLDSYIYCKGLVQTDTHEVIYVDGYFIAGEINFPPPDLEDIDYQCAEPDLKTYGYVTDIVGCEYSNNENLKGKSLTPKSPLKVNETLYSYDQLTKLLEKLGCPSPKALDDLEAKVFLYDVNLVNQKSNFTLIDAGKIAANIYSTGSSHIVYSATPYLYSHYLELLCDCVKGTNQHDFKLHTIELWCKHHDEFGETYSRQYDNGTYLKQQATIDCELTIISKQEFVRWCDYARVNTGLTYQFEFPPESIEALKHENEKLQEEVRQLKLKSNNSSVGERIVETEAMIYPIELQLAIDAFEKFIVKCESRPTNSQVGEWLDAESRRKGITHLDQGKQRDGLSDKKKSVIASIANGSKS